MSMSFNLHKFATNIIFPSVDKNPYLCVSVPCKEERKKKNIVVPVVASVAGTFVFLLIVTAIWLGLKRKQQHIG